MSFLVAGPKERSLRQILPLPKAFQPGQQT